MTQPLDQRALQDQPGERNYRPDFGMWRRALAGIPRVDELTWRRLDPVSRWLIAARAGVLVMTVIPCLIAGILALRDGAFDTTLFVLVSLGLVLAHATNNILNDLTDYTRGVDRGNYFRARYGTQPLEQGLMTVRQSVLYAVVTGGLALLVGGYLVAERGGVTLQLLAAGAFFVLFYTWPLKGIGLGEVAVIAVWGPLMIGGGYYVITGRWDWQVAQLSLVYALGATSVIFGKHIDKLDEDRAKGIRTLPVLIGERSSRFAVMAMLVLPYLMVGYFVATGYLSPVVLVTFLAVLRLLSVLRVYGKERPKQAPASYPSDAWPLWFVSWAFVHNRLFGGLFVLGLLADLAWRALS